MKDGARRSSTESAELSPELLLRAGVTRKELEALLLYDPGKAGYKRVAEALDIAPETARDRIRRGIRKLERATRSSADVHDDAAG
jgi:DNA-directed RNA polymerase specialized sigma24 family protein